VGGAAGDENPFGVVFLKTKSQVSGKVETARGDESRDKRCFEKREAKNSHAFVVEIEQLPNKHQENKTCFIK